MTIAERLRTEFPGIYVLLRALKRAWKAYLAYNNAIKAVNGVIAPGPAAEWVQNVSEHSQLSYEGAYRIFIVITEEMDLTKQVQNSLTEFVMKMANHGHTADMIIVYLMQIDRVLDKLTCDKLKMYQ